MASHPNPPSPSGGTTLPSVRPTNTSGSAPGPGEKASVHWQYAVLSSFPARRSNSPSFPTAETNHLMYGPGIPLSALKQRLVSSTITLACTRCARDVQRLPLQLRQVKVHVLDAEWPQVLIGQNQVDLLLLLRVSRHEVNTSLVHATRRHLVERGLVLDELRQPAP
eukprot:CAMPEP_0182802056 /NCGR_PEP_ID=MMETSP0006_2-20121128/3280_1 /TAXON_ID=97485 /ORGANISM="Prymnesium parvum, Strain Texoma1" /LENGTH=165 /DNA_ID=CAMNT_0024927415 /DNA_START=396 /DNA_END=889 /DNA_ORIENTATION=-